MHLVARYRGNSNIDLMSFQAPLPESIRFNVPIRLSSCTQVTQRFQYHIQAHPQVWSLIVCGEQTRVTC